MRKNTAPPEVTPDSPESDVQSRAFALLVAAQGPADSPPVHQKDSRGTQAGFEDLNATVRGQAWAVECKARHGILSAAQLIRLHALMDCGVKVHIATEDTLGQLAARLGLPMGTLSGMPSSAPQPADAARLAVESLESKAAQAEGYTPLPPLDTEGLQPNALAAAQAAHRREEAAHLARWRRTQGG